MEGNKISTIEEAREFFAAPENEGKHCVFVMPDQSEASLVSLENAESFFAELSAGTTEEAAAEENTASAEETVEEKNDAPAEEGVNAVNGEAVQDDNASAEEKAPETTEEA